MADKSENQVNAEQARHILAGCKRCDQCSGRGCDRCGETGWIGKPWGRTRMSAIKRAMRITGRYFFLTPVREFLAANQNFRESEIYKRKTS